MANIGGDTREALTGMTVLDLTQVVAGPYCSMILGDLGADVIKIESPDAGDQCRQSWGNPGAGDDSKAFLALNRNKRSVVLDLKSLADRAAFQDLVRTSDVVVENWRPGVASRLGVDYESLRPLTRRWSTRASPASDRPGRTLSALGTTSSRRRWLA